jgi:hypothetical protein
MVVLMTIKICPRQPDDGLVGKQFEIGLAT